MTVDQLIKSLEKVRDSFGGDLPIFVKQQQRPVRDHEDLTSLEVNCYYLGHFSHLRSDGDSWSKSVTLN